jgi:oxygen-independent coproporphyrinogen-3 oxidase
MLEYPKSLGLYIHIPWCIKKCPYCDFNSHQSNSQTLPEQDYLKALLADFESEIALFDRARNVSSVFIGGGTPSLLSPKFYATLLSVIQSRVEFNNDIEITMEVNPGAVEKTYFKGFREAGINRLSIGVQSFSDNALTALGRIHTAGDAECAFVAAREAGFNNINIDLMHGLPKQTLAAAKHDLHTAMALKPEHLSWYQLTIERNTAFYKQPPTLPVEDTLHEISLQGEALLLANGYHQYEVSAYALNNDKPSAHNKNYWLFGDYIGIGAGAHGKLSLNGKVMRRWKTRTPADYMQGSNQLAGERVVCHEDLPAEFMMNALRLNEGFELDVFSQRTGLGLSVLNENLQRLEKDGLLQRYGQRVAATARGRRFLDNLVAQFVA